MRIDRGLCISLVLLAGFGCASAPKDETPFYRESDSSSVEIHFVRGHNNHSLFASQTGDAVVAQSFLEHQVLAESQVDRAHYLGFLKQASDFMKTSHGTPSPQQVPCRTPFTVTVRIGNDTRAASGCLGTDEGALSHLVRDGEFLLHQGSGMRVK